MATTSQKMMEIRFLVRIRGALTPPPRMDDPVMKIPLSVRTSSYHQSSRQRKGNVPYQAAPTTESPIHMAMPRSAHAYGETDSRKAPT
jgi:hypothetical protein